MKKKKKPKQRKISDEEFLSVLEVISRKLAYKFKFGYHNVEDMKQQISVFALEGLNNYDYKRPLENFLWTHVRNRLFNYKRDNYQRPDKPCYSCIFYDKINADCNKYANKNECELYDTWLNRNTKKKNLMHLTTIDDVKNYGNVFQSNDTEFIDLIENKEIIDIIERHIIDDERLLYLKIKNGSKITTLEKQKLIKTIKDIIKTHA